MYSDNITKAVAEAAKKVIDEDLKGKQKVLDKNHNNKLDSQDFKILRGEKKAIKEEDAYDKDRYAVKDGKAVKDNPAHMGSKDEPHHVWATSADEALKKKMKEEIERVDEMDKSQTPPGRDGGEQFAPGPKVSKKTIKAVQKDPAKHLSDLLAKEYAKKKMKEEVEQIDELSKSTLGSYIKKAASSVAKHSHMAGEMGYNDAGDKEYKKASKRIQGTNMAVKKLTKESEQIDEGIEDRLEAARAKAKAAGKPIKDKPAAPKSNVRKIEGSAYGGAKQKDEPEADEDDTTMKSTKKGTFKRRYNTKTYKESFTDRLEAYKEGGLKSLLETMQYEIVEEEIIEEEATNDEFTKELDDAKAKNSGAKKNKEIATPAVQAVKNEEVEQIEERELTAAETAKKEHIVKSMKKGLAGFKERYGKDAKSVMYATATKQAKGE